MPDASSWGESELYDKAVADLTGFYADSAVAI